ncbi:29893_t:CDS:1, partial [Racocetra persica]
SLDHEDLIAVRKKQQSNMDEETKKELGKTATKAILKEFVKKK